ncbi:MAG: hypothetical protein Q7U89_02590, partial [Coriobacteriia bacterium]|nr:hypothetical protein [Coriobacteriia bacterium]
MSDSNVWASAGTPRSEDSAGGVDAEGVRAPAEDPERRDAPDSAGFRDAPDSGNWDSRSLTDACLSY